MLNLINLVIPLQWIPSLMTLAKLYGSKFRTITYLSYENENEDYLKIFETIINNNKNKTLYDIYQFPEIGRYHTFSHSLGFYVNRIIH